MSIFNFEYDPILGFQGEYRWLSNFVDCEVVLDGIIYPSVENAYQASKFTLDSERVPFTQISSSIAKRKGKEAKLPDDWKQLRLKVMYDLLSQKFSQQKFYYLLQGTKDAHLEEVNHWGDIFWGTCDGKGGNILGNMIMRIRDLLPYKVFVFGSNLAGRHGAGAALFAKDYCGASYGTGYGRQGDSFAIPTKDRQLRTLKLDKIELYIKQFIDYARNNPTEQYELTEIGCGLAGYKHSDIAPMFKNSPPNIIIPSGFKSVLNVHAG